MKQLVPLVVMDVVFHLLQSVWANIALPYHQSLKELAVLHIILQGCIWINQFWVCDTSHDEPISSCFNIDTLKLIIELVYLDEVRVELYTSIHPERRSHVIPALSFFVIFGTRSEFSHF